MYLLWSVPAGGLELLRCSCTCVLSGVVDFDISLCSFLFVVWKVLKVLMKGNRRVLKEASYLACLCAGWSRALCWGN